MNLIGHVATALDPGDGGNPPTSFLVGCVLPDLAAIARVRISRPEGRLGGGVEFHHATDTAFHDSDWFRATNRAVRDALVERGVDSGPARASSHAGVEMLLDGALVEDVAVTRAAARVLGVVAAADDDLGVLAPPDSRASWVDRLRAIGTTLRPERYRDPRFVAERLQRMTAGRRRIELPHDRVDLVSETLAAFQPSITAFAPRVVAEVRRAVPSHPRPG